jgi:hypothetical protein
MSRSLGTANYYLGVVTAVTPDDDDRIKNDKEWHEVLIDIPGVIQGVTAYPFRDELDEPKINDKVLVLDVDPLYHSYFLYRKLKEDGFIGFRSSGKMVSITPDEIVLGVFGPDDNDEYPEYAEDEIPNCDPGDDGSGDGFAYIKLTKTGDIDIRTKGKNSIIIAGDDGSDITIKKSSKVLIEESSEVTIKKDSTVTIEGNSDITVKGDTTLNCDGNIAINHSNDPQEALNGIESGVAFGSEVAKQMDTLNKKVDEVIKGVNAAIMQSAPCPMDGGATLKMTMIAGWIPSYIKLQVSSGLASARAMASMPDIAPLEPNLNYIVNTNVTTKGIAGGS